MDETEPIGYDIKPRDIPPPPAPKPFLEKTIYMEKRTDWVINIFGKTIPLAFINANLKLIFTILCIALTFRIGQLATTNIIDLASSMIPDGCIIQPGGIGGMDAIINCSTSKIGSEPLIPITNPLNATYG